MVYIKGSEIIDVNNNVTSIAFYLKELQISYSFYFCNYQIILQKKI